MSTQEAVNDERKRQRHAAIMYGNRSKRKLPAMDHDYIVALERAKEGLRGGDLKLTEREIDWVLETLYERYGRR